MAVLVGGGLGALLARKLPDRIHRGAFLAIGLFTLFLGVSLSLEMKRPLVALVSLIASALLGFGLNLEERLRAWLSRARNAGNPSADAAAISEQRPIQGVLNAFLLFCVGSMTILGCLQEGLGKGSDLLLAKSLLDGISSVALAAAYGSSILFVAVPLFLFQSSLTLGAGWLSPYLGEAALADLNGVGGLLLIGLALDILEVRRVQVLNLLPALVFAPILTNSLPWLQSLIH
ncbi:MAG: DUF554 domain-containing protein [Leptospiraceae bacterium]|nr:DUF554 domain-containing protein [Leptospiraceae bacterium]